MSTILKNSIRGFVFTAALYLCSCNKTAVNNDPNPVPKPDTTVAINKDVKGLYIVGNSVDPDTTFVSYLWKDGVKTTFKKSKIFAITHQGNDIYMAGVYNFKPAFWKNGLMTPLETRDVILGTTIKCMVVAGNNIYISGSVYLGNEYVFNAALWKNGELSIMPFTTINDMAVVGKDLYTIGIEGTGTGTGIPPTGFHTKNDVKTALSYAPQGFINSGDHLYIFGEGHFTDLLTNATDPPQALSKYQNNSQIPANFLATSYYVNGPDIYYTGFGKLANAVYLKNGVEHSLSNANSGVYKMLIDKANNIYAAGVINEGRGVTVPVYWKNDTLVKLATHHASVSDMMLIE